MRCMKHKFSGLLAWFLARRFMFKAISDGLSNKEIYTLSSAIHVLAVSSKLHDNLGIALCLSIIYDLTTTDEKK